MARRTPPVAVQVIPAFHLSNARFKMRLIDFDTGSEILEEQHKAELRRTMQITSTNSSFHVQVFGYASKLGNAKFNRDLSLRLMNSVYSFMQSIDQRTLDSLEVWHRAGSDESTGGANDNSPEWRAVEVHIFIGPMQPTAPPPNSTPVTPTVQPLPGGQRF